MNAVIRSGLFRIAAMILVIALVAALIAWLAEREVNTGLSTFGEAVWWSFVTLTTVGYGDRVPVTDVGRAVGVVLALAGVVLAALLAGRVASFLVDRNLRESRGMNDASSLTGHFVICGWKSGLATLIGDVLAVDPSIKPESVVLITSADTESVQGLRATAGLEGLLYVKGDHLEEGALQRANISAARRILILADDTGKYSAAEVDARTVMTVVTVNALAPEAYVCAELLDPKFREHLETTGADEIILTQHSSRALLANASVGTGISGIFFSLMTGKSGTGLVTRSFSNDFVGKRFEDLRNHYAEADGSLLVGLVENAGNVTVRKREALREAQKTADIEQLVDSLRRVKEVESHRPVLNPPDDYIVPSHSLAVLIQRGAAAAGA